MSMAARTEQDAHGLLHFFKMVGVHEFPQSVERADALPDLIRSHLHVKRVERGRVTCVLTVREELSNLYNTLHGGVAAAAGEELARACARTVAGDKELFLGEASTSYLAAARLNAEVEIDACIVRQGRRVIVISVEFRSKESKKLLYTTKATFYDLPVASL